MAYLDAASTEPLHPQAKQALLAGLDDGWADPSRLHREARRARQFVDSARESLAASIGARSDELTLTTSGTQAVQMAVLGAAAAHSRIGSGAVVSAVEHSAVLHAAEAVAGPSRSSVIPVDAFGRVDVEAFRRAVSAPEVAVAALQTGNQEVGTRQPVDAAAEACSTAGVPLIVDAAQSVGRDRLPARWDLLTASAHKWGGPAGVGLLAVRTGVRWRSPWPADGRSAASSDAPGFVNVPAVVAAAVALEAVLAEGDESKRLFELTALLRTRIAAEVPDVEVLGDPDDRLPHVVTFSCLYVAGDALVTELDRRGFSVASGSACSSDSLKPSHVLAAMGALTHGNVRVSLPRGTSHDDVTAFCNALPDVVAKLRTDAGVDGL